MINKVIPDKLKSGRELRGLTQTDLASILDVTRQIISYYENGDRQPSAEIMLKIVSVLNLPFSYFIKKDENFKKRVSVLSFRKKRKTKSQFIVMADRIEELAHRNFCVLEKFVDLPKPNLPKYRVDPTSLSTDEIENIANETRQFWGLNYGPINNLTRLLEKNGVLISKGNIDESIDAFSCWREDKPIIILTNDKSAVRQRFDLAHELAHLIFHAHLKPEIVELNHKNIEKQADYFAGSFLMPRSTFSQEVFSPTIEGLLLLKKRWGISIAAMIMRCNQIELISDNQKSYLFRKLGKNSLRKIEPFDNEIENEQSLLFNKSVKLLLENAMSKNEIINEFQLNINELCNLHSIDYNFFANKEHNIEQLIKIKSSILIDSSKK